MRVGIVTIFPELVHASLQEGVVGNAIRRGDITLDIYNPRDYTQSACGSIDDRPFGGGPGMIMEAEPLAACVQAARDNSPKTPPTTVYMTPQGNRFDQATAEEFAEMDWILLVAGRYEGVDERFIERYVDREISVGDYVLSGGELAALVVLDVVGRLKSGTLSNPDSIQEESFSDRLLGCPHYTRPREFEGLSVPDILLSGDHKKVEQWRTQERIKRTWERRPELLLDRDWSEEEEQALRAFLSSREFETTSTKEIVV